MIMMAIVAIATAAFAQSSIYVYRNDGNLVTIPDSIIQSMECSKVDSQMVTHTNYVMQIIKTASGDVKIPLSEIDSISFVKPVGDAVDLGLSVRWASYNVGANSSEEYGGLYGWADPTGENTTNDVWDNNFTWISPLYGGVTPPSEISGTDYDIARAKWGSYWRLPSSAEIQELIAKCTWQWTANGMKVTGPNGNSIFLPAAGHRDGSTVSDAGTKGYYWSGTLSTSDSGNAQCLVADEENWRLSLSNANARYMGQSVRPVSNQPIEVITGDVAAVSPNAALINGSVRGTVNAKDSLQIGVVISTDVSGKSIASKKTEDGTFSVTVPSLSPSTNYYYRAYLYVDGKYYYGSLSSFTTPAYEAAGELVDLGLSVKWASCNVGATSPEQQGKTCVWADPAWSGTTNADAEINISASPYDMARAKWGGKWRIPMDVEIKELIDSCTWTWMTFKGATGYKVTGPNGNSIFLPASSGNNYYWSGTRTEAGGNYAYSLDIYSSGHEITTSNTTNQFTVRPVQVEYTISVATDSIKFVSQVGAVVYYSVKGTKNPHSMLKTGVIYGTSASLSSSEGTKLESSNISDGSYSFGIGGLQEGTNYYCRGYMQIDSTYYYGDVRSFTTKAKTIGDAIDLGLSVKWASCNVGAATPEGYGGYYGWADPTGTKTSKNLSDYPSANPPSNICGTEYDMARAKWGGNWRLPTQAEMQELVNSCTWTWTTQNGVNGMKVTGTNGNSIFLPAAGYRFGTDMYYVGSSADYWSGTLNERYATAYYLDFSDYGGYDVNFIGDRNYGFPVRPVVK
jgi:hypothetical protein